MSKMVDLIKEIKSSGEEVSVVVPGRGPLLATVTGLSGDVVTIAPKKKNVPKVVMHVTQFVLERD